MFKQSISTTPLTSDAANAVFRNIIGEPYGSDVTFLASLRALVAPRLPEGESVNLYFGRSDFTASAVSENSAKRMVEHICYNMHHSTGRLYIHNLCNRDEASNAACFELLKNKFTEVYTGWRCLEKVTDFYHKSFKVLCFINPELKSTALFVESLNIQKVHYLQCSILAIMPWYFDPKNGIEEVELNLIKSLRERTSANYEACLAKIAEKYDFQSARIRQLLAGFETKYEKMECERVRREINDIDTKIANLNTNYANYNRQRNDACIRLLGLETKIASGDSGESEIMDYFLCNRKLYLESVSNTEMYFAVKDYLSYYDEDAVKRYIRNKSSYVYSHCGTRTGDIRKEQMEKLMNAIFVDEVLKIKFCAAYSFNLNGSVRAQNYHVFGTEFSEFMPNPHIDRFSCLGNNESKINNQLVKHDYIGAIEQCVASAKSLNWHDSTVMNEFFYQLTGRGDKNIRCIELPDKTVVKPKEAIAWLEDQEKAAKACKETEVVTSTVVHAPASEVAELPF